MRLYYFRKAERFLVDHYYIYPLGIESIQLDSQEISESIQVESIRADRTD